ncbi:hypothetical protein GJ496_006189 [Pomphorhynchus laevis]|nr:hypothetical protein GJ496_006189 [Pomphorhynchus laevis]
MLVPLRDAIVRDVLPGLTSQRLTDDWCKVLTSPIRLGGIGVSDPCFAASLEFDASAQVCSSYSADNRGDKLRAEQLLTVKKIRT